MAQWRAVESNPETLTTMARRFGLSGSWAFVDVFGFDDDSLSFVPQPCLAVIFLFNSRTETPARGNPEPSVFYMKQVHALNNACGTIAAIHAIANNADRLNIRGGPVFHYLEHARGLSPEDRGNALANHGQISEIHNEGVQQGQTEIEEGQVNYHFVCFTEVDGKLFELDGMKAGPISHGAIPAETSLLSFATQKIKEVYVDPNPDYADFSIIALAAV